MRGSRIENADGVIQVGVADDETDWDVWTGADVEPGTTEFTGGFRSVNGGGFRDSQMVTCLLNKQENLISGP